MTTRKIGLFIKQERQTMAVYRYPKRLDAHPFINRPIGSPALASNMVMVSWPLRTQIILSPILTFLKLAFRGVETLPFRRYSVVVLGFDEASGLFAT